MNYLKIIPCDVVNGDGIRVSLFVSGCSMACDGCFNKNSWNYKAGKFFDAMAEEEIFTLLSNSYISGLSILGGDGMADKNYLDVMLLCAKIKYRFPDKEVWVWTGYTLEELQQHPQKSLCLNVIDVLIDGKFEKEKADKTLWWRGSTNQRILRKNVDF